MRHNGAAVAAAAFLATVGLLATPAGAATRTWEQALGELLAAPTGADTDALVSEVVSARPAWTDVVERIRGVGFADVPERGVPIVRTVTVNDTLELPWVLVVPEAYDPGSPTPLLVVLHGGVSRASAEEDPAAEVREDEFAALAASQGWLALFPFGQIGATWWDEAGMANIRNLVRTVKRECNVDDDRVWLGGFSDGASAAFLHAMVAPSDYAAFLALNGHMGVGSIDGNLPTYAPNLSSAPIYAVTTFDDQLYPSRVMRRTIEMACSAGADILYRELPGEHDFTYAEEELPTIAAFLMRHPRDPFPRRIAWEAARPEFGACRWLSLDRVTLDEPEPWHHDFNVALPDETITIGFLPDERYEGEGVLVGSLPEGDYPAREIGLAAGDVIVKGGETAIRTMDDVSAYKTTLRRGGPISLTVDRGGRRLVLEGALPEAASYNVFKRELPSALAVASWSANRVDVQASRLGAFRIRVHPDMFHLGENVVVSVNGTKAFDGRVEPDLGFLLRNFLETRDRTLLYVAEIPITVP